MQASIILTLLLVLGFTGCALPMRSKVTAGHRLSKEALAFLDLPGTTREEVIASLGPPLVESSGTLVYEWETTGRLLVTEPDRISGDVIETKRKVVRTGVTQYVLFIAYDERQAVVAHETRKIHDTGLAEACVKWRNRLDKRREGAY